MFNLERAKAFLDEQKKLQREKKKNPRPPIPPMLYPSDLKATSRSSRATTSGGTRATRGPTGYNLFVSTMSPGVKASLAAKLRKGESLPPRAAISEVARQWKALSDADRLSWNRRAALA